MRRTIMLSWVVAIAACRDDGGGSDDGADDTGSEADAGSTDASGASSEGAGSSEAGDDSGSTGSAGESAVDEARRELSTYLDLHDVVISRTCTPNEGVCHNDKEYRDLHTPQAR